MNYSFKFPVCLLLTLLRHIRVLILLITDPSLHSCGKKTETRVCEKTEKKIPDDKMDLIRSNQKSCNAKARYSIIATIKSLKTHKVTPRHHISQEMLYSTVPRRSVASTHSFNWTITWLVLDI